MQSATPAFNQALVLAGVAQAMHGSKGALIQELCASTGKSRATVYRQLNDATVRLHNARGGGEEGMQHGGSLFGWTGLAICREVANVSKQHADLTGLRLYGAARRLECQCSSHRRGAAVGALGNACGHGTCICSFTCTRPDTRRDTRRDTRAHAHQNA